MELILMLLIVINITLSFVIVTVLKKLVEIMISLPNKMASNLFGDLPNMNTMKGE